MLGIKDVDLAENLPGQKEGSGGCQESLRVDRSGDKCYNRKFTHLNCSIFSPTSITFCILAISAAVFPCTILSQRNTIETSKSAAELMLQASPRPVTALLSSEAGL